MGMDRYMEEIHRQPEIIKELQAEVARLQKRLDDLLFQKPMGPRAQVVTVADVVTTKEGYRYAVLLQECEEKLLDQIALNMKLERQLAEFTKRELGEP